MNEEFSRTLSLLRQEKGVSQRTAAGVLGISQALLSHYENGIREPGLSFVVKACDYYGVSADFLLGRTLSRQGSTIAPDELYDLSDEKDNSVRGGVLALLSDSTNAERPGYTPSERVVGDSFANLVKKAENKRIIIATFSSNLHRIQQLIGFQREDRGIRRTHTRQNNPLHLLQFRRAPNPHRLGSDLFQRVIDAGRIARLIVNDSNHMPTAFRMFRSPVPGRFVFHRGIFPGWHPECRREKARPDLPSKTHRRKR